MKIAFISTFYPFRGGIAQFNANLYEELKKKHEVVSFTFTRQYPHFLFPGKTQYVTPEDKAIPIDSIPILDSINPFSYFKTAKRIAKEKPDIVITRYWMSYLAPSLGMVAKLLRRRGFKVIAILDNVIPHESKFFDKPCAKWFLKHTDGCISMSKSVEKDMLSLRKDVRHTLSPHPLYNHFGEKIDPILAKSKLGINSSKRTLLFFGLIRDYKGLDLLIDAMNYLDNDYQLLIAGESYGSFEKYDQQINSIQKPDRVKIFNRYIEDEEVPIFFSSSDVCILPYKSATQSGITAIAYHLDVPLIATRTGGLSEAIEEPGTGLMVPEISSQSIAETIMKFFTIDRKFFIDNIQKQKELLTWENFSNDLINLVKSL